MQSSDAFEKVKGLISDMIARLKKKAFCDKELAESNAKKSDKTDEITKLSTNIEQLSAKSAQLKEQVATLQSDLSKLAKAQADMDQLRQNEAATFAESKAELEKGIAGLKAALKVLNEYYSGDGKAHAAAEGAAGGIISLLEVAEADFSKNLAEITSDEEAAVAAHEKVTKENEIEKTTKDQDVKYKVQESSDLDKTAGELSSDRAGVQAELDAVQRAAEIAGLKQALEILETETALVQRRTSRRT